MKVRIVITLILFLSFGCNSTKQFYNSKQFYSSGNATLDDDIEVIKIIMTNDLPFCNVRINNKNYKFLIDTGAPTLISEEIFQELNLKESHSANVGDSQNKKQRQKYSVLPNIKIDNVEFEDIGCIVLSIDNDIFKCYGFDGIVGANLMSKLFWKFDYQNNELFISKDLSLFDIEEYDFSLNFSTKSQKTPIVRGKIHDKMISFTFDTGYSGNIKIANDYDFYKNLSTDNRFITKTGTNSIGLYGKSDNEKTFEMKNNLFLDTHLFENELIDSGASTLIGNRFLKDYMFVIDWVNNKIYFKRNSTIISKQIDGFGFSYLFVDGKPKVVALIEDANIPIQIGDEIISIDEIDYTNIENLDPCDYLLNKKEGNRNEINLKIKRDKDTLNYVLQKQVFIK